MARRRLPDALRSAEVKLKRANLHTRTGTREMMRFFGSHEEPDFAIEPYGDAGVLDIGDEFSLSIVVKSGSYPDLPDSFAARFGDALHNYRCVLDHIAWQLVRRGSDPRPADPNLIYFPLEWTERRFWDKLPERLPGVAREQVDFIHARHTYKRGKATNKPLLSIVRLSNDDKHRTIQAAVSAFAGIKHEWKFTQCELVQVVTPDAVPKLKPGAEIVRLTCIVKGPKAHMEMGLTPSVYIALENRRPMFQVLHEIREEVEAILYAPEIAAGF